MPAAITAIQARLNEAHWARETIDYDVHYEITSFSVARRAAPSATAPSGLEAARKTKVSVEVLPQPAKSSGLMSIRQGDGDLEISITPVVTSTVHQEIGFNPPLRLWRKGKEVGIYSGGTNSARVDDL